MHAHTHITHGIGSHGQLFRPNSFICYRIEAAKSVAITAFVVTHSSQKRDVLIIPEHSFSQESSYL